MGSKILVLPDPTVETMIRGIIIPPTANSQLEEATVIKISPDVVGVYVNDRILYPRGIGVDQEYDGVKYKFINGPTATSTGDVWAIL